MAVGGRRRGHGRPVPACRVLSRAGPDRELVEALLAERPEEEDFDEIEEFDDAIEAWEERWDAVMFAPERAVGVIVICHLGCAQQEWLIIGGSHRSTISSDSRVDDAASHRSLASTEGQ
ncbi:hypothetical protein [Streptomyces sp. NPDC001927]